MKDPRLKKVNANDSFVFEDAENYIDVITAKDYFAMCKEAGIEDCDLNAFADIFDYACVYSARQIDKGDVYLCFK